MKKFLLTFFENNFYAGWRNIATTLIKDGECVVAGNSCIWVGGIGNFIKIEEAPDYIDCVKYKFDLAEFKKSSYYKEALINYLDDLRDKQIKLLEEAKQYETEIETLVKEHIS